VTAAYDLARIRRILILLSAGARAARSGRGVPLTEAVRLTGARSTKQVVEDVDAVSSLWLDPGEDEDFVHLSVEDGAVHVLYAPPLGGKPPAFSLAEGAVLLAALAPFAEGRTASGTSPRGTSRRVRSISSGSTGSSR
jgi:proteasome accessory factor C